jgi:hypothetical protein
MTLDTRTPAERAYDDLKSGAIYFQPQPAGDDPDQIIDILERVEEHFNPNEPLTEEEEIILRDMEARALIRKMKQTPHGRRMLAYFDRLIDFPKADQDAALDYATDLFERIADGRGYTAEEQAMLAAHRAG